MKVECPHCHFQYPGTGVEAQGKKNTCQRCHKSFIIRGEMSLEERSEWTIRKTRKAEARGKMVKFIVSVIVWGGIIGLVWLGWSKLSGYFYREEQKPAYTVEQTEKHGVKAEDFDTERENKTLEKMRSQKPFGQVHCLLAHARANILGDGLETEAHLSEKYASWNDCEDKDLKHNVAGAARRMRNAEFFISNLNKIFKDNKLQPLSNGFYFDFVCLAVYTRSDAWSVIRQLGIDKMYTNSKSLKEFHGKLIVLKIPDELKLEAFSKWKLDDKEDKNKGGNNGNIYAPSMKHIKYIREAMRDQIISQHKKKIKYIEDCIEKIYSDTFNNPAIREQFKVDNYSDILEDEESKEYDIFMRAVRENGISVSAGYGLSKKTYTYDQLKYELGNAENKLDELRRVGFVDVKIFSDMYMNHDPQRGVFRILKEPSLKKCTAVYPWNFKTKILDTNDKSLLSPLGNQ